MIVKNRYSLSLIPYFSLDSLFEPGIQNTVRDYLEVASEGSTAIFSSLVVSYRGFPSRANVLMSMINAFSDPSPHNPEDPWARGREEGLECLKKVLKAKYDAKKIDETLLTNGGVIDLFSIYRIKFILGITSLFFLTCSL